MFMGKYKFFRLILKEVDNVSRLIITKEIERLKIKKVLEFDVLI